MINARAAALRQLAVCSRSEVPLQAAHPLMAVRQPLEAELRPSRLGWGQASSMVCIARLRGLDTHSALLPSFMPTSFSRSRFACSPFCVKPVQARVAKCGNRSSPGHAASQPASQPACLPAC